MGTSLDFSSDLRAIADALREKSWIVVSQSFVTLEGIPGVGKTTLLEACRPLSPACEFGGELPAPSQGETGENYVRLEPVRKRAIEVTSSARRTFVSDRSVVSTIVVGMAKEVGARGDRSMCLNEWPAMVEALIASINNGAVLFPSVVLHLDTNTDAAIRRQLQRDDLRAGSDWVVPSFVKQMRSSYRALYDAINGADGGPEIYYAVAPEYGSDAYRAFARSTVRAITERRAVGRWEPWR